jgi:hypothetical protein
VYLPKGGNLWTFLNGDIVRDNPSRCRVVDFPKVRKRCGHYQRERYIVKDRVKAGGIPKGKQRVVEFPKGRKRCGFQI